MEISPGAFVLKEFNNFDRKGGRASEKEERELERIWNSFDVTKKKQDKNVHDELVMLFDTGNYYPEVFRFLAGKEDFEKTKKFTGECLDMYWYARSLNAIRDILKDPATQPDEQKRLQDLGRILLGDDPQKPGDFFTSLSELYDQIKFEDYKPNEKATQQDVAILDRALDGLNSGVVVDLGCGTGRLIVELAKQKSKGEISDGVKLVGIDSQPRHIEIAKAKLAEVGGQQEELIEGSWYDIPLEPNSVDVLYCLGRSLPHVEDNENFKLALIEIYRVLKPGGILIFDMPDPHTGSYRKAQKRVENGLRMLGKDAADARRMIYRANIFIVDGPDDSRSYNRFAPEISEVKATVSRAYDPESMDEVYSRLEYPAGFEVAEIGRVKVAGGKGADNVYMVAYKPEHTDLSPELEDEIAYVEKIRPAEEDIDSEADDKYFHAKLAAKKRLEPIARQKMEAIAAKLK